MRDSRLGCVERFVGDCPFRDRDGHLVLKEASRGKDTRSDRHWFDR